MLAYTKACDLPVAELSASPKGIITWASLLASDNLLFIMKFNYHDKYIIQKYITMQLIQTKYI